MAELFYEALRRALEKADGLDLIFKKHIKSKDGKYIVFCANVSPIIYKQQIGRALSASKDKEPILKNALFAEQLHLIGLAHLLAKESSMLRDRGRFVSIVIMRSTSRKRGD